MPGGDRTGPTGEGPLTGRAAGYCAGFDAAGFANPVPGGLGRGLGRRGGGGGRGGHGRRNRYYATGIPGRAVQPETAAENKESLKRALAAQLKMLKRQIDEVQDRLEGLDETKAGD